MDSSYSDFYIKIYHEVVVRGKTKTFCIKIKIPNKKRFFIQQQLRE